MFTKFYIKKILLIAFVVFVGLSFTTKTEAATNIYYSVGQNTTDHKTGTPTVTIADGVATFSVAQTATNMGVGDIVNYGGQRAFISGKTSTSVWSVQTATGTIPVATTTAPVTSITHAFSRLSYALNYGASNATSSLFLNLPSSSLVEGDYILNIPCYYDTGSNVGGAYSLGLITGPNNYLRIYTPTSTDAEVNQSQRHTGKWDTSKWYNDTSTPGSAGQLLFSSPINHIQFDGLQVRSGANNSAIEVSGSTISEISLSNSIISSPTSSSFKNTSSGSAPTFKIYNNLFQNSYLGVYVFYLNSAYIYNNTFYNLTQGISIKTSGTRILKNNLFASTTIPVGIWNGTAVTLTAGTDYNSTATSSLNYTVTGSGNTHDRVGQTISFFDSANGDFHLSSSDASARNLGADLSLDPYLPFNVDMQGEIRPQQSIWDIGADEYVPVPDITPPGLSAGSPSGDSVSVGSVSTTLGLETNEDATCRYSTSPNIAFDDTANNEDFSTTGNLSHSTVVSGLQDGHIYKYYVRCQDGSGNANTDDYEINFGVHDTGIVYANSCSVADVQYAAYNYMEVGERDKLKIPAGVCTWGLYTLWLDIPGETIEGAGQDQTIIQLADDLPTYSNGSAIAIVAQGITVKSMTIRTGTTAGSGTAFIASADDFRITDIKYINQSLTTNGYFVYPSAYGLIDNNDIRGGAGNNELIVARGPTNSWQIDNSLGKKGNLFIENNIFRGSGYVSDCNSNARCVVRNNTVTANMKVDGHGLASNSPARGVRSMEVYNNHWIGAATDWTLVELRGGTGIVFNNTTDASDARFYLTDYGYTAAWSNFENQHQCLDDYPVDDQIGVGKDPKVAGSEPMYLWNNLANGSLLAIDWKAVPAIGTSGCATTFSMSDVIQANIDYFTQGASFDGTSGVGSGTLASRPSTCTTGVGYFATDQGSWNISGSDGVLYKCTSTNTWTRYYMPYAYPHGLTASSTIGTNEIDIGAGARIFGNSKFYNIGTANGNTADLSVTPASGDLDNWLDISVSTWENTGTRHKVWTENSDNFSSINTVHVVGDLEANTDYNVKVDNVLGQDITGDNCTGGVCTSNGSGRITFTYSGGYSEHEFDVEQMSPDIADPIISSIASSTSVTTATITWTTDEPADSRVEYGLTIGYGLASTSASLVTSHSITITGLSSDTLYHFKVTSEDSSTNSAESSDYTFTTSEVPDITAPVVTDFTIPSTASSLTVSISSFTATDAVGVTGYKLTESSTAPAYDATGWTSSAPANYVFSTAGAKTLYAWAKDAAGNVSASANDTITITLPSTETTITSFDLASPSTVGTVNNTTNTVSLSVPYGTSLTNLTPTIVLATGATISPNTGVATNFTTPQTYTVTAEDGTTTEVYTVTVTVGSAPETPASTPTVTTVSANGPIIATNIILPGQVKPRQQTIYPDGRIVYMDESNSTSTPTQTQTTNTVSPTTTTYTFTRDLSLHSRGLDVKALQQYLNAKGFTIAKTGPGSPGNETTLFGTLTYKALVKFQKSVGLPATGYFGKMTRGRIVVSD